MSSLAAVVMSNIGLSLIKLFHYLVEKLNNNNQFFSFAVTTDYCNFIASVLIMEGYIYDIAFSFRVTVIY